MSEPPPVVAPSEARRAAAIRRASPEEAVAVWHQLMRGDWTIIDRFDDEHGRRFVLARYDGMGISRPWHRLSQRERAVVAAVATGHTNQQIATALGISVSTVAGHLRVACRKLGGARRLDLVREWSTAFGAGGGTTT